jgi:cytoskeletal protein CcmA (bactofilin family)
MHSAPPPTASPNSAQAATPSIVPQKIESGNSMKAADSEGIVVIGKGTKITGQISDCAKLEIQGTVEGTIVADALVVREGGVVKGDVRASHAEIHGLFEGQLAVRDVLDVRGTGHVQGELSYGQLAVAMGGYISGNISSETNAAVRSVASVEQAPIEKVVAPHLNGGANGYAQ